MNLLKYSLLIALTLLFTNCGDRHDEDGREEKSGGQELSGGSLGSNLSQGGSSLGGQATGGSREGSSTGGADGFAGNQSQGGLGDQAIAGEQFGGEPSVEGNVGGREFNEGVGGFGGRDTEQTNGGNSGVEPIQQAGGNGGEIDPNCAPEIERCDLQDNDCDGRIDEDTGNVACQEQEQECLFQGVSICLNGILSCDIGDQRLTEEQCNGEDDDCDGSVDEQLNLEQPCTIGLGVCENDGDLICQQGVLVCEGEINGDDEGFERCDLQDNDCDGRVDEDFIGNPCQVGEGACQVRGEQVCQQGRIVCNAQPRASEQELCNGEDDDCDGRVDEQVAPVACERGLGRCQDQGVSSCENGRLQCDATPGAPLPEQCNGEDDDCDGNVDEFLRGEECTAGLGNCFVRSREVCVEGRFRCIAEPNFDAQMLFEQCNNLDDDCDGRTDEEVAGAGDVCEAEQGACRDQGERRCAAGEFYCSANPRQEGELCNGEDDDCDGRIDEELVSERCVNGVGSCANRGMTQCVNGESVCDADPLEPGDEFCDNADNDCDGTVDEDTQGRECVALVGERPCTGPGTTVCENGNVECAPAFEAGIETCNEEDDDCDGRVDEDLFGDPCDLEPGVCYFSPVERCLSGEMQCFIQNREPADVEICNSFDDDCDGIWNEGFVGEACNGGVGACRAEGIQVCRDQRVQCAVDAIEPGQEECNGEDDDCDGNVNEGLVCD